MARTDAKSASQATYKTMAPFAFRDISFIDIENNSSSQSGIWKSQDSLLAVVGISPLRIC